MIGKILIDIAFASALLSLIFYFFVHRGDEKKINLARIFFHISAISIISTAAFLFYLILTHQYQYTYIWEHSNSELQLPLLISTFYAGQEGSFLLWTLFTAIIGIVLLNYVSKGDRLEPQVMGVYCIIVAFLAFILILKTPFLYVWESFPKDVEVGFIPEKGKGLNPLLQNFWMSIHPPTLFTGFASLAVPFCFAIATLIKNKYDEWVKFSMPWLLFSGGVLGLGIMMGGYWAYGVLGWGGYWAWDPVENSSFIPWLVTVAAVHTMVAQKRTGGYKKTNLILCILTFLLVLYSTFLTRSGILGDSSVHSFVDPGNEVYLALVGFISLFIIIALAALFFRRKELKALNAQPNKLLSRESSLFLGTITLCAAALVVFAGTSWPIVSKGSIDAAFYNKMNLPIAIIIALMNGIGILLKWKNTEEKQFFKSLIFPFIISMIVTLGLVVIGVQDFLIALFAMASFFAFFVNAEVAVQIFRKNKPLIGAYVAHVGIALVFLGIIGSAKYSQEKNLSLELNKPVHEFGYTFTYLGASIFDDPNNKTDTKYHFNVNVNKDGEDFNLQPIMYFSEFSNGVLKNPDIKNFATKDLYLSPMGLEQPEPFAKEDQYDLKKGEEIKVGDLKIEFIDFDFGNTTPGGKEVQSGNFTVGAKLKVTDSKFTENLSPKIKYVNNTPEYQPAKISENDNYEFYFTSMNVAGKDNSGPISTIAVVDKRKESKDKVTEETLIITATIKPFINVLWIGTGVLVIGFFISILRRRKELYK